jgi:tyrosyl-tRNA synthetase
MLSHSEIDELVRVHRAEPHLRILQKRLAEELTVMAHSREDYDAAVEASQILFGKGTTEQLHRMEENTFLAVFEGVPMYDIHPGLLSSGVTVSDLCAVHTKITDSKGEFRRLVQGGGVSLNKEKIDDPEMVIKSDKLLNNRYLLLQKGKKSYYLIRVKNN